ncbi:LOW QUALITY PROTEIN: hypothetical protein PHMEG_0009800 [Phytophthora megakarya]|uniref:Chromo domain-containing protein n=1 Tax=Phytophthora megakarya TaxID=4795 RepID=A0A225WH10_9STRA|nr:LOW QUALITY PROTEIN: hypothetical protein PHMEG_0009800 [Phytophthora megakarya]
MARALQGEEKVAHVSRLKAVSKFEDRPKIRLAADVTEDSRFDFDDELLPWEPNHLIGEFEVEDILDDRVPLSVSTERAVREFQVKWAGCDTPLEQGIGD